MPTSVRYGQQIHPIVGKVYSKFREPSNTLNPSKKLYISRKNWTPSGPHRVLLNAREIEAHYQHHGFDVIHPEDLSFKEKLIVFQNAAEVVGEKGTALHLSLFSNSIKKMTVLLNPSEKTTGLPLLQGEICKMLGVEVNYKVGQQISADSGYTVEI